ncbi:MAG TPA: GNAT family N-acetyltransferase [Candidatus Deferrimicrobiaceae bacterium]|nr:GNAT family N-acetyltransferase [Candidatus Deferrimicrobiaceae bacterium]
MAGRRTDDEGVDGAAGVERLKRERAGSYRTTDGRFAIEAAGTGWMVLDAEQTDELGLPLVRGPFETLDDARQAIRSARLEPAPESGLATRTGKGRRSRDRGHLAPVPDARRKRPRPASRPATPPVITRELRVADGPALRALWAEAGFRTLGDDDLGLARLLKRNPGLVLVAVEGRRIVASALGAWDGRRGWIYHVATAASHRRRGIAARLVHQIEESLRALGCPKVNVLVGDDNDDGLRFWAALGYETPQARQYDKELTPG